jgi:hypothetical protein
LIIIGKLEDGRHDLVADLVVQLVTVRRPSCDARAALEICPLPLCPEYGGVNALTYNFSPIHPTDTRAIRPGDSATKITRAPMSMAAALGSNTGPKSDELPVRFQLGDREYVVDEVLDQWYGPDETFYRVRADDGTQYIVRHHAGADEWRLESFRRLR